MATIHAHKYVVLTAIFLFAAVLSAHFSLGFLGGIPGDANVTIGGAAPGNNSWLNASQTNTSVIFPIQFVYDNASAYCYLSVSVDGAAFDHRKATNTTVANNTLTNLFWNATFTSAAYRWFATCTNGTDANNITSLRNFYYDNVAPGHTINFPSANVVLTSLTPSPLQANVVETQWNVTNITTVNYY